MTVSLLDIANRIVMAIATAASSALVPLPQGTDYLAQTSFQLTANSFISDPTVKGHVLAETVTAGSPLQAFIFNDDQCPYPGGQLFYRLYIGNTGVTPVKDIVIQFEYPAGTTFSGAAPQPTERDDVRRLLIWRIDGLAPLNGYIQLSTTLSVIQKGPKTSNLSVRYGGIYGGGQVATTHTVPDGCGGSNSPTRPRPANKQPAIVCDPAETSCQNSKPTLGARFQAAQPALGTLQLGKRFAEAVADIIPGECRVAADDIISSPGFADALNRKFDPAAFYMDPLYRSGQDFKKLVHENTLLGIPLFSEIQQILQAVHTKHWQKQVSVLQSVLEDETTTQYVRSLIDRWHDEWTQETKQAQQTFAIRYGQLQPQKKQKFDPVAQQAIANARSSIARACNQASDGGLAALLPPVKKTYEDSLAERQRLFSDTQALFADPDSPIFGEDVRSSTWKRELRSALDAFDQGNPKPLKTYIQEIPSKDSKGFSVGFELTYTKHRLEDIEADEKVRLQSWKTALDAPKKEATDCEKEKIFKQRVETTFCESRQGYPEILGEQANRFKSQHPLAKPFDPIPQAQTFINPLLVKGRACSGQPGDPWWSNRCECNCNDVVPGVDANGPTLVTCQGKFEIVRHDINASKEECLAELNPHRKLFF